MCCKRNGSGSVFSELLRNLSIGTTTTRRVVEADLAPVSVLDIDDGVDGSSCSVSVAWVSVGRGEKKERREKEVPSVGSCYSSSFGGGRREKGEEKEARVGRENEGK